MDVTYLLILIHYASYLDISFHVAKDDVMFTKLYDKRDDFDFRIVNFPNYSGTITSLQRQHIECIFPNSYAMLGAVHTITILAYDTLLWLQGLFLKVIHRALDGNLEEVPCAI